MNQKTIYLGFGGLLALTIWQSIQLHQLEKTIMNQEEKFNLTMMQLSSSVHQMIPSIEDLLTEQQSSVTHYQIEYQEIDAITKKVPITISIELKEYSDATNVSLQLYQQVVPLEKKNSTFFANIMVSLTDFTDEAEVLVIIEENGVYQTERLPETLSLQERYFVMPSGWFTGSRSANRIAGQLEIDTFKEVQSIQFFMDQNEEHLVVDLIGDCSGGGISIEETVKLEPFDTLTAYAIITDLSGYTYYYTFFTDTYDAAGNITIAPIENQLLWIKDVDENILYEWSEFEAD